MDTYNRLNFDSYALILPSLNPTDKLTGVVKDAVSAGFTSIILVDDGSDAEHKLPFEQCAAIPGVTLLVHEQNRGKGAALKTAIAHLLDCRPDIIGAVTADGDGQHLSKDILACARSLESNPDALIMGCRNFDLPHVPVKSKKGNKLTCRIFRAFCGIHLSDTQTGLRAIGRRHFATLLEISGVRYEYETNMLLELHRLGVPFVEVEISTVYEDNNSGSHFRPVRDSVRIYRLIILHSLKRLFRFFKYLLSSCIASVIDLGSFWLLHFLFGGMLGSFAVIVCTVVARLISSFVNFNVNRRMVFSSSENYGQTMLRYYILCFFQLCASAALVWFIDTLIASDASWLITLMKALVDTALFFISYQIQRRWVFAMKK